MKDKKDKKGKNLESTIGKIIYGFLLFAPLLIVLTTCCYSIFNKNAYRSYYGETINKWESVQVENLNTDTQYHFEYNGNNLITTNATYSLNTIVFYAIPNNTIDTMNQNANDIKYWYFFQANNQQYCVFRDQNNNAVGNNVPLTGGTLSFDYYYTAQSNNNNLNNLVKNNSTYKVYNQYSYMDNNFEYGLYKAENSTLFNWSKNTAIYTILSTTCVGLGITNTFTPFLMAYWLLISVIYFIYDIGLMLIMVMHRKIHEMQEGI